MRKQDHTMMGKPGLQDLKGFSPRSLEQVFQTKQMLEAQGWKYDIHVSMLEIYNETLRDQLSTNKSTFNASRCVIKHDANGNTYVSHLTRMGGTEQKEEHVPFTNSKLTNLLQTCLGGDSKTLMFVNVSPDPASVDESLCSLRFAARVNVRHDIRSSDSRLSL
ncbi:kinesin-like protein KIN-14M [Salvia hispanica]|uniref:kinesin-like protein KIN-14M n=1 Tax=Salvia hispanica TaxID=49212 RepID=UPI00200932EA|nr:kinesin-like protein KIN-14M [Salvia hispanica]